MRFSSGSLVSALFLSSAAAQTFNSANVRLTFYSFVDNTDNLDGDCNANCDAGGTAGNSVLAMQCPGRSGLAGGTGTQDSPITAASAGDGLPVQPCGSFYVPYLQKWFIYEDFCTDCQADPPHFDLFAGGGPDNNFCPNICECENQLTPGGDTCIFTDISDGGSLTVSGAALFDGSSCNFAGSSASSC
ncbi:ricin B lectin [Cladophialophora carrionii]|uniref:Ricin B lectin n=1 Tax=Cladophialophora carrionii TaxID=86049 RepID=A0A1C1CZM7_9EURO|nr:ricin B lectin [Cladophialophora carrionii]